MCDSAGVMYWGDSDLDMIETAYLNGTGRTTLLTENSTHYFAFALHDGHIYFTDWGYVYVSLFLAQKVLINLPTCQIKYRVVQKPNV